MNKQTAFFGWVWMILLLAPAAAAQQPEIAFDQEKWDFGRIKEGKVVTHIFIFSNKGGSSLEIQRVRTSCGCTAALVSQKILAPGENGELKVTFNTRGYAGNVSKYVYIHSNDPRHPQIQLSLNASIDVPPRPRIALNKYTIDLGLILQGEDLTAEAEIRNSGELELQVDLSHRSAVFLNSGHKIQDTLKIPAGKSKSIEIRLQPRNSTGLVREYILLKSNDPQRSNLSIYLSGYILTRDQVRNLFEKYEDIIRK
jgi:hypothetical protein